MKFKNADESCLWQDIVRDAVGQVKLTVKSAVAYADEVILEFRKRSSKFYE